MFASMLKYHFAIRLRHKCNTKLCYFVTSLQWHCLNCKLRLVLLYDIQSLRFYLCYSHIAKCDRLAISYPSISKHCACIAFFINCCINLSISGFQHIQYTQINLISTAECTFKYTYYLVLLFFVFLGREFSTKSTKVKIYEKWKFIVLLILKSINGLDFNRKYIFNNVYRYTYVYIDIVYAVYAVEIVSILAY